MAIAYILTDPEFFSAQGFPYQSRMETPEWPAGFYAESYPQVVQLLRNPKGGEDQIRLNHDWLQYLDAINPSDKIFSNLYFGFNKQPPVDKNDKDAEAKAENVGFGGQMVKVLEKRSGSARIETLYFKDGPPDPAEVNHELTPHLVHQVSVIHFGGQVSLNNDFWPILGKYPEGVWIPLARLRFDDAPPPPPVRKDLTNQQIINAFFAAFGVLTYWAKFVQAVPLYWPAAIANRSAPWSGPLVYQFQLSDSDREKVHAEILKML